MSIIVEQIIGYHLKILHDKILPTQTFEELGADELDMVEICMDVEEKLAIVITDEELDAIKTAQDFYDLVRKKLDEKPANSQRLMDKPVEFTKKEEEKPKDEKEKTTTSQ